LADVSGAAGAGRCTMKVGFDVAAVTAALAAFAASAAADAVAASVASRA
jgi:hypothetical protein